MFSEIEKLNLPLQKYVVFGGAALQARGIRETADIDIVATADVLEKCKSEGWEDHPRINQNNTLGLHKGIVELYPDVGRGLNLDFEYLRKNTEIINGIPFCNLEDIIQVKRAYGREKDLQDIELIRKYIGSRK